MCIVVALQLSDTLTARAFRMNALGVHILEQIEGNLEGPVEKGEAPSGRRCEDREGQ